MPSVERDLTERSRLDSRTAGPAAGPEPRSERRAENATPDPLPGSGSAIWSPGAKVGGYVLGRQLGRGGMAEVWMAWRSAGSKVALRRIRDDLAKDTRYTAMFCDEAEVLAPLAHPNIVKLLDFCEAGGEPFMVLEYVDGVACSDLLKMSAARGIHPGLGAALHVAREISSALDFVHDAKDELGRPLGIVHRDVSPGNILISRSGDVKLTDFGIVACHAVEQENTPFSLKGKLGYMAPEQIAGNSVDRRSDLFALGVVLAEMLLARPLFSGIHELEILTRMYEAGPRLEFPVVPPSVRELLEKALARDSEDRFQSARAFSAALESVARSEGVELEPDGLIEWLGRLGLLRATSGTFDVGALRRPQLEADVVRRIGALRRACAGPDTEPEHASGSASEADSPADYQSEQRMRVGVQADSADSYVIRWPESGLEERASAGYLAGLIATGELHPRAELRSCGTALDSPADIPGLARLVHAPAFRFHVRPDARAEWVRELDPASLPWLLTELVERRATGVLIARDGRRQKRIYFAGGTLEFMASTEASELLGARLIRRGWIARERFDRALDHACERGVRLGEALVVQGALRPAAVLRELAAQIESRFLELGSWREGELLFVAEERPGLQALRPLRGTRELISALADRRSAL